MNVLYVTAGFPAPPTTGGSQRAYHLLRLLGRRHRIHLFSLVNDVPTPDAVAELQPWCAGITLAPVLERSSRQRLGDLLTRPDPDLARRFTSPGARSRLPRLLNTQAFDVVQVEGLEASAEVMAAYAMAPPPRPALVLDAFNAEYLLQRRAFLVDLRRPRRWPVAAYSLIQWRKLRRYERAVCRRAAVVLAVSEEDRRALLALDPHVNVVLVPHGVDTDLYRPPLIPAPRRDRGPELLFTGTMDFRPNVDAVTWFCAEILPRIRERIPDVRLTIVGRNPTAAVHALAGPHVDVTGPVPDDLPYFQRATAFVLPMRYGGGVRLKLLQALAAGLPVVSTPLGADGVDARLGEHMLVAEGPEAFAQEVVRVLSDGELATRLGAAARALVEDTYRWETAAALVEQVYQHIQTHRAPITP